MQMTSAPSNVSHWNRDSRSNAGDNAAIFAVVMAGVNSVLLTVSTSEIAALMALSMASAMLVGAVIHAAIHGGVDRAGQHGIDAHLLRPEFGGQRLEVLELGTAARHTADGEIALTLPPDQCWAYRDEGQAAVD